MLPKSTSSFQSQFIGYPTILLSLQSLISCYKATTNAEKDRQSMQQVSAQAETIVHFMGSSLAYTSSWFSRSVIVLDNLFILYKDIGNRIEISKEFLQNLLKHFCNIIESEEQDSIQDKKSSKYQSKLYSCLYLILLLGYKSINNEGFKATYTKYLLNKKFISRFTQICISKHQKKLIRVIVMILLFTCKHRICTYSAQCPIMCFQLISIVQQPIAKNHLMQILRSMSHRISYKELEKYCILEFILNCLENSERNQARTCLITLNNFLKKQKSLGTKLLQKNFMKHFDKNINFCPQICLQIFSLILPYVPKNRIEVWFNIYFNYVLEDKNKISWVHLEIVNNLLLFGQLSLCYFILQSRYLSKISDLSQSLQYKIKSSCMRFKAYFLSKLDQTNSEVAQIYRNLSEINRMEQPNSLY